MSKYHVAYCFAGTSSVCHAASPWESFDETAPSFYDAGLARATREVNDILTAIKERNFGSKEASLIVAANRLFRPGRHPVCRIQVRKASQAEGAGSPVQVCGGPESPAFFSPHGLLNQNSSPGTPPSEWDSGPRAQRPERHKRWSHFFPPPSLRKNVAAKNTPASPPRQVPIPRAANRKVRNTCPPATATRVS